MSKEVPHSSISGDQAGRLRDERYLGRETDVEGSSPRENMLLWIAVLGSAVVWLIELQTSYSLVPWVCVSEKVWVLHVVSVACLVLAAVPAWVSWSCWNKSGRSVEVDSSGDGRRRFMALLGLMLSGLFFLLILAQALPRFFINPCVE